MHFAWFSSVQVLFGSDNAVMEERWIFFQFHGIQYTSRTLTDTAPRTGSVFLDYIYLPNGFPLHMHDFPMHKLSHISIPSNLCYHSTSSRYPQFASWLSESFILIIYMFFWDREGESRRGRCRALNMVNNVRKPHDLTDPSHDQILIAITDA